MKKLSNTKINKVGKRIREEYPDVSDSTLYDLQTIRTAHQLSLSEVFHKLCGITKKVDGMAIVSYRLKRLDSVITKLDRYPKMSLSRMWDIGGCRCILKTEKQVYKLWKSIAKELNVRKHYDYIVDPQPEGYKAIHLFIESDQGKVIEVQIRTQKQHNWATLVEISDVLFDAGLKEFKKNIDLLEFHKFLSVPKEDLTIKNKKQIAKILKKYDYYNRLNEVFLRNSPNVRSQWIAIKQKANQKYFILKTSKDEFPQIISFENSEQAELEYFRMFLTNKSSNIVLTHFTKPNFNQISTAYSNYILTYHSFIKEWIGIYQDLIVASIENYRVIQFKQNYQEYMNLTLNQISSFVNEVKLGQTLFKASNTKDGKVKKMFKYWESDIVDMNRKKHSEFAKFNKKLDKIITPTSLQGRRIKAIKKKVIKEFYKNLDNIK